MATNPQDRPTAQEVLVELGAFVRRTPPERLHVPIFFKPSLSLLGPLMYVPLYHANVPVIYST